MAEIDWESVWNKALENKELFPVKSVTDKSVTISCPTRFSSPGAFSIEVSPTFNKSSIALEMLIFNDNVQLKDINLNIDKSDKSNNDFNKLSNQLVEYELSNRIMDRFIIKSKGFDSEEEAVDALVDYLNSKATESGRMFDDKLDELNDAISTKDEKLTRVVESIKNNRRVILKKVESILKSNYGWKSPKNEDLTDTTASFYDADGNLAAVVSLVDNCIIVDLAKGITSKVSMLQSDEEIESELTNDVENAQDLLANRELSDLKGIVADDNTDPRDPIDNPNAMANYLESLERKVTKLENLYIRRKLRRR